jgi:maltose O-acetyltransferase
VPRSPEMISGMRLRQQLARLIHGAMGFRSLDDLTKRGLQAGSGVSVAKRTYVDAGFEWAVTIGIGATISHDVTIIVHDAASRRLTGFTAIKPVTIGANAYIGARALLLPGATVGDRSIIGAGSVVVGSIPADTIAAGNPCRPIRSVDEYVARSAAARINKPVFDKAASDFASSDYAELKEALAVHGVASIR